jgi:hypothetical protein
MFDKQPNKTPTSIGTIVISLIDPTGDNADRVIRGTVTILDQNGEIIREWKGDLREYLTSQRLTSLATFMTDLRTKAAAEFLP